MARVPVPRGNNPLTGTSDLHRHTPGRSSSSPPGPHTIVSGSHTDTTGTPGAGDILIRNGSSQWQPLVPNSLATSKFLRTVSSGLPSYQQVTWADLDLTASDLADLAARSHADLTGVTANQHHSQVHGLIHADHPEAGLTIGHVVRASGATTYAFAQLQHADLGGIGVNDHHSKVHALIDLVNHPESGLTIGHVVRATGATTYAFGAIQATDLPNVEALGTALGDGQIAHSNGTNLVGDTRLFFDRTTGYVGFGNSAPQGVLDIYNNSVDHYSIFRWGTEATNQGAALRFMVAAAGVAAAHTNLLADIRCLVSSTPPAALQSRIEFYVNKGDALTQMMVLSSALGLRVEDGVLGAPAARIQSVGGSYDSFAGGTSSREFRVSSAGDLSRIRNVPYVWPAANAVGVLNNDGAGNLSWAAGGGSVTGTGLADRVAFWTSASNLSYDNNLAWDNTLKTLCLGTTTGLTYALAYITGTRGWLAFGSSATIGPAGYNHIGGQTYGGNDHLFFRCVKNAILCLDYGNSYTGNYFKILRDANDPSGGRTLLTVVEDGTVVAGDGYSGSQGALAMSAVAAGGYAVRMGSFSSPTGNQNRSVVQNTVVSGSTVCHWSLDNGYLIWEPAASIAPANFSSTGIGEMIGPYYYTGTTRLLVYESRGNHEFVLDTDNNTTNAQFEISRNAHWSGAGNLYYLPGAALYGEILFTVNESGEVFTPAWKIRRREVTAAYTLDTWINFYGTNDLLLAVTTLGAALTITLPAAAAGNAGRVICIKDETGNAGTYNISVSVGVDGGGGPTVVVNAAYGVQWLYSSGAGWFRC